MSSRAYFSLCAIQKCERMWLPFIQKKIKKIEITRKQQLNVSVNIS